MDSQYRGVYNSPIGPLEIVGSSHEIIRVDFLDSISTSDYAPNDAVAECIKQLTEYFQGARREFDLKLNPEGSDFEQRVWRELLQIPFGTTRSYADIANRLGKLSAVRAVGRANGRNRIAIIIPCHRVIGSNGSLTGYGGGLWRKEWLLKHEGLPVQARLFS